MAPSPYYRHSGRFSPFAVLAILLGAGLPAVLGGAVYGILVWLCPLLYANFLGTVGLGLGLGWLVLQLAKVTYVRNPAVAAILGLGCGVLAVYTSWVGWIFALSNWEAIVVHPADLLEVIQAIGAEGAWSLSQSSDPVRGVLLYAIWAVEAAIIVGCAAILPFRKMAPLAFCEPCRLWVEQCTIVGPFTAVEDIKAMRARLEKGEFAALGDLEPVTDVADRFSQIDLWRCEGCDAMHLMTLRTVEVGVNKKGEVQRSDREVVRNLIIDRESRDLITTLGESREAAAPESPESPESPAPPESPGLAAVTAPESDA